MQQEHRQREGVFGSQLAQLAGGGFGLSEASAFDRAPEPDPGRGSWRIERMFASTSN
jgi:hypothetical protein